MWPLLVCPISRLISGYTEWVCMRLMSPGWSGSAQMDKWRVQYTACWLKFCIVSKVSKNRQSFAFKNCSFVNIFTYQNYIQQNSTIYRKMQNYFDSKFWNSFIIRNSFIIYNSQVFLSFLMIANLGSFDLIDVSLKG